MKLIARVFGTALVPVVLGACGAAEPQNEAHRAGALPGGHLLTSTVEEARQYVADGQREWDFARQEEAYANFQQAIAADPKNAFAHLLAWGTAPNLETGQAHRRQALALAATANEYERLTIEAIDANSRGDNVRAQELAQQLVEKYADNARVWAFRSWTLFVAGERQEERAALQKAIEVDPTFTAGYMWLGESYTLNEPRDLARAEQLLQRALELEPREAHIHDLLADVFRLQGDLEKAAISYTRAAELDPTNGLPLQQRGHVNSFLGRFPEARADYDAAVALETGMRRGGYAMYRSFVHLHEGNPRGAIDELEQLYAGIDAANVEDPDVAKLTVLSQVILIAQHEGMDDVHERAVQRRLTVRQARIARTEDRDLRRNDEQANLLDRGFLAAYSGDFGAAERAAAEFMKLTEAERSANKNWPAHDLLGTIALLRGDNAAAVEHFRQTSPDNQYAWWKQAVALERLGRIDEAREFYRRVAETPLNSAQLAITRKAAANKLRSL